MAKHRYKLWELYLKFHNHKNTITDHKICINPGEEHMYSCPLIQINALISRNTTDHQCIWSHKLFERVPTDEWRRREGLGSWLRSGMAIHRLGNRMFASRTLRSCWGWVRSIRNWSWINLSSISNNCRVTGKKTSCLKFQLENGKIRVCIERNWKTFYGWNFSSI